MDEVTSSRLFCLRRHKVTLPDQFVASSNIYGVFFMDPQEQAAKSKTPREWRVLRTQETLKWGDKFYRPNQHRQKEKTAKSTFT
jgi:hypothetical protein